VVLDPDPGVRTAITVALDAFAATGSAFKAVRSLRDQHLGFPARHHGGPHHGELYWKPATHTQMLSLLHNPRYAGAYCYGRARHTTDLDGHHRTLTKSIKDWTVFIPDANPGYITWAQYETNQATLLANAAAHGSDRTAGPARPVKDPPCCRDWPPTPSTPTRSAPHTSSAPSTTPTPPGDATSPSTRPAGWSPTPSKPTGTPPCVTWPTPKTTTPKPRPTPRTCSTTTSASASGPWPWTSPPYGTTRPHPCANANA
jgi:hypothetical protein